MKKTFTLFVLVSCLCSCSKIKLLVSPCGTKIELPEEDLTGRARMVMIESVEAVQTGAMVRSDGYMFHVYKDKWGQYFIIKHAMFKCQKMQETYKKYFEKDDPKISVARGSD